MISTLQCADRENVGACPEAQWFTATGFTPEQDRKQAVSGSCTWSHLEIFYQSEECG